MEWKRRNRLLLSSFLGLSLLACGGGTPGGSGSTKCSGLNAGDIIITEIMANPKGPDGYQEYVEIYNPTSNPIELNGVKVFISKDDGSNEKSKVTLKSDCLLISVILPPPEDSRFFTLLALLSMQITSLEKLIL